MVCCKRDINFAGKEVVDMKVRGLWMGIIVIIIGVLVLVLPAKFLSWIVGIGLIVVGVLALLRR
jgi:uncharacterized membrane protein HdeD (DUF308 family)